jgi:hypothetical protein
LHEFDVHDQAIGLALANDLFDVVRQARPRWRFSDVDVLNPLLEVFVRLTLIRHNKDRLVAADGSLEEFKVQIEGLSAEDLIAQRLQDLVGEIGIEPATADGLSDQCPQRVPWNLIGVDVLAAFAH